MHPAQNREGDGTGIRDASKTPLFRSAAGKTGPLTGKAMHASMPTR
jgi:hypothetical protein